MDRHTESEMYSKKRSLSDSDSNSCDSDHKMARYDDGPMAHTAFLNSRSEECSLASSSAYDDKESTKESKNHLKRKAEALSENIDYHMNPKVHQMMMKMAYKGKGLGKHEQGVRAPIEASKQKGRRGLGFQFTDLDEAVKNYRPEDEIITIEEPIEWLSSTCPGCWDYDDLLSGMVLGKQKLTIDDETSFCDPNILRGILSSKSVFDRLDKYEMRNARTRSNPFETIRNAFFQNRAALKMANIDKMCDFMFTNPPNAQHHEPLYFADVCAGPGGFSEYVLWRKRLRVKGFGFTLKRSNDFKLEDFLAGPTENFHPYYGPFDDLEKQGDIFLPKNQIAFRDVIMEHTHGNGVHFMMADGGFSVEGQENIQEILSKQLYLCQCLVALMIVRKRGHFVTKLFDLFTPFSVSLVYLMYQTFESISIIKPNTSRPANSERYIVCKNKREDTADIEKFLFNVNKMLLEKDPDNDVLELIPIKQIIEDEQFFNYIKFSNEDLGSRQITGLVKIAYFVENKNKIETKQEEMRKACLNLWDIPINIKRMDFKRKTIDSVMRKHPLLAEIINDCTEVKPDILDNNNQKALMYPYSYYYTILQYNPNVQTTNPNEFAPAIYIGLGGSKVYRRDKDNWTKVDEIMLPEETVIYGELVVEYDREGNKQMKKKVLHVIDACMIDGINIADLPIHERMQKIKMMCHVLWGLSNCTTVPVRAKELLEVRREIHRKFNFRSVQLKSKSRVVGGYVIPRDELSNVRDHKSPYFFVPASIMFIKFTHSPMTRNYSRSNKMLYYSDGRSTSIFEQDMRNHDHLAGFVECFKNRIIWSWYQDNALTFDGFMQNIGSRLII